MWTLYLPLMIGEMSMESITCPSQEINTSHNTVVHAGLMELLQQLLIESILRETTAGHNWLWVHKLLLTAKPEEIAKEEIQLEFINSVTKSVSPRNPARTTRPKTQRTQPAVPFNNANNAPGHPHQPVKAVKRAAGHLPPGITGKFLHMET